MKRLFYSTVLVLSLGACAGSGMDLPSVEHSAPAPKPINAVGVETFGTVLPLISDLAASRQADRATAPGVKRPRKSEMRGNTWVPPFDRDNEYVLPVQTTNADGSRTVQQVLVTSDLPVGRGSCAHKGFQVVPMGSSVAIAPLPGAPVGAQVSCAIEFGGNLVKVIVEAASRRGIAEMRLEGRSNRRGKFPTGVCSDANYTVSKVVSDGPMAACTVVDANGANSATYFKLPSTARETPIVKIGDGENARLARFSVTRLPTGERLVRVQGSHAQLVLFFPNGEMVAITRGA